MCRLIVPLFLPRPSRLWLSIAVCRLQVVARLRPLVPRLIRFVVLLGSFCPSIVDCRRSVNSAVRAEQGPMVRLESVGREYAAGLWLPR